MGATFVPPIGEDGGLRLVLGLLLKPSPGFRKLVYCSSESLGVRGVLQFYDRAICLVDEVCGLDHLLWGRLVLAPGLRHCVLRAHLHEHVLEAADVSTILTAPGLFPLQVFGHGVSVGMRLIEGLLKCLELSPVGIAVGGGTPEGLVPRGLRLQHADECALRRGVSMAQASLEQNSEETGDLSEDFRDFVGDASGPVAPADIHKHMYLFTV